MKTLTKLLSIAWNDIRIDLTDRSTFVFLIVLPLVFTFILATAMRGTEPAEGADNRFVLPVVDNDQTAMSASLVQWLEKSRVARPEMTTPAEADRRLNDEKRSILVIPVGFADAATSSGKVAVDLTRAPGDTGVLAVQQAVSEAAQQLAGEIGAARVAVVEAERVRPFASSAERATYFNDSLAMASDMMQSPPAEVRVSSGAEGAPKFANAMQQSSAGQLVTWVMITLVGVAEVLVNERLWGTLRRLVVTPTSKATILGGKIAGRLGMGILQIAVMVGFGAWVLGVDWGRSPAALLIVLVAFAVAAVSLGMMLGTLATTRNQASGLTIFASMVLSALGGAWWPIEITPQLYQDAVKVLPTTWAMTGLNNVIVRGAGVATVLPEAGILVGFAAIFFLIAIRRFRFEA